MIGSDDDGSPPFLATGGALLVAADKDLEETLRGGGW